LETAAGRPLGLDPESSVKIDADGTVSQAGVALGRLKIVDWDAGTSPAKRDGGYFELDNASLGALKSSTAEVHQGFQEQANLSPAEASVRLVDVLRQFESLGKAVQIGAEMSRHAIEDVARVAS
jgi:flagellar basal body rod protein FlgG